MHAALGIEYSTVLNDLVKPRVGVKKGEQVLPSMLDFMFVWIKGSFISILYWRYDGVNQCSARLSTSSFVCKHLTYLLEHVGASSSCCEVVLI